MANYQGEVSIINLSNTDIKSASNFTFINTNYSGETGVIASAFNTMIWAPDKIPFDGEVDIWANYLETSTYITNFSNYVGEPNIYANYLENALYASDYQEFLLTDYRGEESIYDIVNSFSTGVVLSNPTVKQRGQMFVKITGRHRYGGI